MEVRADSPYTSANHHKHTHTNPVNRWHLRVVLACLGDLLTQAEPQTILDAGCGEGFVTDHLARRDPAWRLTGVDLSEEAVGYARAHFGERATFRKGSVYKLPFSDNSFDAVVCSEVLEHLDDPPRAVSELKRVARRHVLITVPREPYFQWLNALGQRLGLSPDPGHVNFWTKETFQTFVHAHFDDAVFAWKHTYQMALATV